MESGVKVWEISGDDYETINSVIEPDHIVCREESISAEPGGLTYKLNAHSIYVFEIKKRNR